MSLYATYRGTQNDPYQVYVDLSCINNSDGLATTNSVPFTITNQKSATIIDNPSLYFLSVVRFSLQTSSLPVMMVQPSLNSNDVNQTVYKISMVKASAPNTVYTQTLDYYPTNNNYLPPTVFDNSTYSNLYYSINDYQIWVQMVNNTLLSCFNSTGLSGNAPFIEYDPITALYSLYTDTANNSNLTIYFNAPLYSMFSSLACEILSDNDPVFPGYRQILNPDSINPVSINYKGEGTQVLFNKYTQSSTSISIQNPVQSLVFVSTQLPIIQEFTSASTVLNGVNFIGSSATSNPQIPTITDFQVNVSAGDTYRNNVEYVPSAEYRLIDMVGQNPLSSININVFWQDRYGVLHPFLLDASCGGNIKLLFRRKSFNGQANAGFGPL